MEDKHMKITDVRLRKVNNQDTRMKALVSVTFDDAFVVDGLRVIDGNNGLFVAMLSKRTPDGEFRDIAHPINTEMRQHVQEEVMRVYEEIEDPKEKVDPTVEADPSVSEEGTVTDEGESGSSLVRDENISSADTAEVGEDLADEEEK